MFEHLESFKEAMAAAGLNPPEDIELGRFLRIPGIGKDKSNRAGWCKLFPDGQGGTFGDYSTDLSESWQAKRGKPMTAEERKEFRRQVTEARRQAEPERQAAQEVAAEKAARIWKKAKPAKEDHPYLVRKGIKGHGIRQSENGRLLVPLFDAAGKLWSLQYIDASGSKRFFPDGKIKGCYFSFGAKPESSGPVCIAEGYATAATIQEATGYPVAVAFNAGNLKAVAEAIRVKLPAARLICCADDDCQTEGNPGLAKAREAAQAVGGLVAVPEFGPERPEKATDFNDLAMFRGLDAVRACIEAALKVDGERGAIERIKVVGVKEFMCLKLPPRENILSPWLPRQGLTMVYAPRGAGKTHFSLGVAYAVACGASFLTWEAPIPRGVLFLDGEMPAGVLQERLTHIIASNEKEPGAPLRIITPDLQPTGMIDLASEGDRRELAPHLEGVSLVVVDNLSTLCRKGKENEGEGWLPVQEWALAQRAAGRSVLFIHHAGKNGEQRGTSRREDVLDTVLALRKPGDYSPDKGACFEVHFEKARGIYGNDTKPFEAHLVTMADGRQEWTTKPLEQSTAEKVANLLGDGMPQTEIAEMLGITKGAVSKAKKRAEAQGLLAGVHE